MSSIGYCNSLDITVLTNKCYIDCVGINYNYIKHCFIYHMYCNLTKGILYKTLICYNIYPSEYCCELSMYN